MFSINIGIDRPINEVFAFLKDIKRAPDWYSAVKKVVPVDGGEVEVGKRYRFEREIAGRKIENEVEVAELRDGEALTLKSRSGPTPFTYRYSLSEDGLATSVKLEGEITGEGLPGILSLAAPFASKAFERGMHDNLATLKRLLERP